MNPQLLVLKRKKHDGFNRTTETRFAVVNAENPKGYPSNFICTLPKGKEAYSKKSRHQTVFVQVFGKGSLNLAWQLLSEALIDEKNPLIITAIKNRLKIIEPLQTTL